MFENSNCLIEILKCFLFEEKYNVPENLDIENMIKLAELHSVSAIVGAVLEKSNAKIPDGVMRKITVSKVQCGMLGAVRENIFNEISEALEREGIENIIVKGYVLRELYPVKDLRTMTDLDFVIKGSDGDKMERVMAGLGYDLRTYLKGDWSYFKNNMHIEFHEKLTESELGNGYDYDVYLRDCFSHTIPYKGFTRTLNREFHLIYMLIHCAKHFYNGGCGFRMIMDFGAYLKAYNSSIDWEYVNGELKKIMLYDFSKSIWYLCQLWFGIKAEGRNYTMKNSLYYEILGFVTRGGTFGEGEGEERFLTKTSREIMENGGGNIISRFWHKLKFHVLFDDESMRTLVPWYANMPKIMLPVAWLCKGITAVNNKGINVTKDIIIGSKDEEKAKNEYNMLKGLGLYRNKGK